MIVPIRTPEDARSLIDQAVEWLAREDNYDREDLEDYVESAIEMTYEEIAYDRENA
jgi:hypothetical protein